MSEKGFLPNEKGFTLLEILIATVIFAVGMLAVAVMQTTAVRGNTLSRSLTEAVIECNQHKIEQLLALEYDDSDLGAGAHGPETKDRYTTSWNVNEDSPYSGAKTITITTTWRDQSGPHNLRTLFVKDERLN